MTRELQRAIEREDAKVSSERWRRVTMTRDELFEALEDSDFLQLLATETSLRGVDLSPLPGKVQQ